MKETSVGTFATSRPVRSTTRQSADGTSAARTGTRAGETHETWRAVLQTVFAGIAGIALFALVPAIRSMAPTHGADGAATDDAAAAGRAGPGARGGVPTRYRVYADCLWPVARNHGFFELQVQALDGDAVARALWLDFVAGTGANACTDGSADITADTASLERALADTREAARRHFAATVP